MRLGGAVVTPPALSAVVVRCQRAGLVVVRQWMEETFVDAIWEDPSCGDSICQSGFEDPGWGHEDFMHGCLTDCGALENVTEVVLVLDHTQLLEEGKRRGPKPLGVPKYHASCCAVVSQT